MFYVPSIVILVAGSIFAMWLGEKITDKGIGNGISILLWWGSYQDFHLSYRGYTNWKRRNGKHHDPY
jgi:preprotein translocase subunit SecY